MQPVSIEWNLAKFSDKCQLYVQGRAICDKLFIGKPRPSRRFRKLKAEL